MVDQSGRGQETASLRDFAQQARWPAAERFDGVMPTKAEQ
jgi:hypothetical protein